MVGIISYYHYFRRGWLYLPSLRSMLLPEVGLWRFVAAWFPAVRFGLVCFAVLSVPCLFAYLMSSLGFKRLRGRRKN